VNSQKPPEVTALSTAAKKRVAASPPLSSTNKTVMLVIGQTFDVMFPQAKRLQVRFDANFKRKIAFGSFRAWIENCTCSYLIGRYLPCVELKISHSHLIGRYLPCVELKTSPSHLI
jgi:hypothetical protein